MDTAVGQGLSMLAGLALGSLFHLSNAVMSVTPNPWLETSAMGDHLRISRQTLWRLRRLLPIGQQRFRGEQAELLPLPGGGQLTISKGPTEIPPHRSNSKVIEARRFCPVLASVLKWVA